MTASTHSHVSPAPDSAWQVSRWFNAPDDFGLEQLRGRVVVLHTFQMLCPGCVSHGIPQAKRVRSTFDPDDVAVVGLHTVFEHHAVMTEAALEVFLHEYRITFPVGVDRPSPDGGPLPETMRAYELRGTPSVVLFDRAGTRVSTVFGQLEDLSLGAAISALVEQPFPVTRETAAADSIPSPASQECTDTRCPAPK